MQKSLNGCQHKPMPGKEYFMNWLSITAWLVERKEAATINNLQLMHYSNDYGDLLFRLSTGFSIGITGDA